MFLAAALAGCGGSRKHATPPAETAVKVYFLVHGKVQPVRTLVPAESPWRGAFESLAAGPTAETPMAPSTALRLDGGWTLDRTSGDLLRLRTTRSLPRPFLAQAVYTLTQFTGGRPVVVDGRRYTRADFEDLTPAILVESPLPLATVTSPLRATGTANTFEATFQYSLVGPDGKVSKTHFVTATSGTGTRGTFDFSVPFDVAGAGKLVVFELSAADGTRIHQVEIPVQLAG